MLTAAELEEELSGGLLCSFLVLQLFPAFEIRCKQERKKKCHLLWSIRPSIILLFGKVRALGPTSWGAGSIGENNLAGICVCSWLSSGIQLPLMKEV